MDEEHLILLNKVKATLASVLDCDKICELLQQAKIFTQDQVNEIKTGGATRYCKNLLLIQSLQQTNLLSAFDEFIRTLEITNSIEALRVLNPESLNKISQIQQQQQQQQQFNNTSIPKNFVKTMADKFFKKINSTSSSSSSSDYPLGYQRCADVTDDSSKSVEKNNSINININQCSSPLKETHRATLIRSDMNSVSQLHQFSSQQPNSSNDEYNASLASNISSSQPAIINSSHDSFLMSQFEYMATKKFIRPLSSRNQSSGDDHNEQEDFEHITSWPASQVVSSDSETDSITSDTQQPMIVKSATLIHEDPVEDYKMSANPRGPCLIINNVKFKDDIFPQRHGSEHDARRFADVFKQLGFTVILKKNQSAEQMKYLFKSTAKECIKENDALFVILLSHGSDVGIYASDGIELDLNDIIAYFDNKNCNVMVGKPKVFVMQACRGRMIDYGVPRDCFDAVVQSQSYSQASSIWSSPETLVQYPRRSEFTRDYKGGHHPLRSDILLIFSCLPGYLSVRNEQSGSWLGLALTYFIMTNAHERDLCRILNMVSADIRTRVSQEGHTQSIEVTQLGWTKNLYFNPGFFG